MVMMRPPPRLALMVRTESVSDGWEEFEFIEGPGDLTEALD